jgi:hypothetical protein
VWSKITIENPTPRLCHSTLLIGQWIFLFGGHNSKHYDNDIWALNLGGEYFVFSNVDEEDDHQQQQQQQQQQHHHHHHHLTLFE